MAQNTIKVGVVPIINLPILFVILLKDNNLTIFPKKNKVMKPLIIFIRTPLALKDNLTGRNKLSGKEKMTIKSGYKGR
ncbi:unnamed protein product [marine sediment metagenome]|uniref:Uncharacterized protein n=1 Tax=marine sediment metagenome TaxID=412755 RepID=X0W9A0_9ZZZZ